MSVTRYEILFKEFKIEPNQKYDYSLGIHTLPSPEGQWVHYDDVKNEIQYLQEQVEHLVSAYTRELVRNRKGVLTKLSAL